MRIAPGITLVLAAARSAGATMLVTAGIAFMRDAFRVGSRAVLEFLRDRWNAICLKAPRWSNAATRLGCRRG